MGENDGLSQNSRSGNDDQNDDTGSSTKEIEDDESSENTEAEDEENSQRNGTSPTFDMADEESEDELDDDQMMAIDDQLAQILKDRERGKKDKGPLSHLTRLVFVNSRHRRGTKRSHALQKSRYGSFGHLR
jgi:DNA polymerase phi